MKTSPYRTLDADHHFHEPRENALGLVSLA